MKKELEEYKKHVKDWSIDTIISSAAVHGMEFLTKKTSNNDFMLKKKILTNEIIDRLKNKKTN